MSKMSFEKGGAPVVSATEKAPVVIDVQATPAPAVESTAPAVQAAVDLAPVEAIPARPVNLAVAPVAPSAVAVAAPKDPLFNDENISFDDIIVPRLNIVQKVGDLSNVFGFGEIVLNQSLVVHTPANKEKGTPGTGPLTIVPLGFKATVFVEKVKGGGRGAYCTTREEVVRMGGTVEYREWKASGGKLKRFEHLATVLCLIKRPDHIPDENHQVFTHEIEGTYYALAFWSMKGTAYTHAAKRFFTERKIGFLKRPPTGSSLPDRGYPSFAWSLTTKVEPFPGDDGGTNYAIIPILTPGAKNSEALLAYVKEGIGLR